MLEEAKKHKPGDRELTELARRIEDALTVHAALEEKLFYPELRDRAEEQEQRVDVFEAFTEHDLVKHLIALLTGRRRSEDEFKAQLQVLGENVRHHVQEEESTIFSIAKDLLDAEEREEIGQRWERAKSRRANASPGRKASTRKKAPARKKSPARKTTTSRKKSTSRKKR